MTPGIHSMPAEQYRKSHGVSNSSLKWIAPPLTPAHYHAKNIARTIKDEESDALTIGTITHRMILEPESGLGEVAIRPEGLSFASKEGKLWKAENEGKAIIKADVLEDIEGMRDAVWNHPAAASLLRSSEFERSVFADDKGLLLKARYDILPRQGNVIADLKTCQSADLESVEQNIWKYGYFRQAAFYVKIANLLGLKRAHFVFIFVEKTPPYAVAVYTLTDDVMRAGQMLIERDLFQLRQCLETDQWPGYSDKIEACALPAYAMKQIEALV